jgi:hypothetical protein
LALHRGRSALGFSQDHVLATFNTLGTPPNSAIRGYMNDNKVPQLFVATGATKWNDPKHYQARPHQGRWCFLLDQLAYVFDSLRWAVGIVARDEVKRVRRAFLRNLWQNYHSVGFSAVPPSFCHSLMATLPIISRAGDRLCDLKRGAHVFLANPTSGRGVS